MFDDKWRMQRSCFKPARAAGVCLLLACTLQGITLVEKGKSKYTIVIAAQASPSEHRAAEELQRFLFEMSGAKLPVIDDRKMVRGPLVLLGDSAALRRRKLAVELDRAGAEGFVIQTAGSDLVIAGGRQRGTMYGVYTFLDQLGCRWFTKDVSRIPKLPTVQFAAEPQIHRPAFEYREPFFTEAWDKDWAARNRTNGDHTQLDASTGGKLQYYPFVHSFNELVPPEKYFKEHPEYFSLIDSKRRSERSQLCLTNREVLRRAIESVERWIQEHPEVTIFSVSQNDWEGWCECDQCRRVEKEEGGEHSGPLLRFVNAVAEDVGKRHPDKLIDTLAYWYTENPPLKVRPVPNVRIRLCPIGICVAHSFATCPRSAYFRKNLKAWSKITNQLYIWHYNTNFSQYLLPFPDFDELAADIPLYEQNGVVGLFMQGAYAPGGGGGEASELRAYVLARQLWDPSVNIDRTVNDFLEGVYGSAAQPVREYFDLLHREVRPPAAQHLWIFNVPDYSAELRRRAKNLFTRAESLAPDEATRRRVLKARLPIDYYELLQDSTYEVHDGAYSPTALNQLVARAQDLFARMRTFGIESIHEGQDLNRDESRYRDMKPLPVVTLENAKWQVHIVPALDARVIRFIDKSTSSDLLRSLPTGEGSWPAVGGQIVSVHSDYQAKAMDVVWTVEAASATRVTLTGRIANGIRIERKLELQADGLHTTTAIENTAATPVPAVLQVRAEFTPGDIDTATMTFTPASGSRIEKSFIVAGEQPTGKETWSGSSQPAGEWNLNRRTSTIRVTFPPTQTARSYASWTAKSRPGVTFGLWSAERTLAPGQSLRLNANYAAAQ